VVVVSVAGADSAVVVSVVVVSVVDCGSLVVGSLTVSVVEGVEVDVESPPVASGVEVDVVVELVVVEALEVVVEVEPDDED